MNAPAKLTQHQSSLLDFFISDAEKHRSVDLYRSRILVGISLSIGLALLIGAAYIWLGSEMGQKYQMIAQMIILPMALVLILNAFFYKYSISYVVCANTVVIAAFLGIMVAIYITGGILHSPAQLIVTFPVVLAFCLLGKYWGVLWTATTFLVQFFMEKIILEQYRLQWLIEQERADEVQILIYVLTLFTTAVILVIYEGMQSRLKTERDLQEARFLFLATHDHLTQLPNRVLFYDRAELAVSRANREKSVFAILYLDLNGFKPVNDKYGHEAGDHVLQVVAERLQCVVRETDLIARLGGDEFAIITENIKSDENIDKIAEKIIHEVERPITYLEHEITVGASIGVSFFPNDARDIEVLVSHADAAMYVAKSASDHYVRFGNVEELVEKQ